MADPDKIPVTSPDDDPTEAMDGLLLLQNPPIAGSVKSIGVVEQITAGPVILPDVSIPLTMSGAVT
jgi:hypothetical protein